MNVSLLKKNDSALNDKRNADAAKSEVRQVSKSTNTTDNIKSAQINEFFKGIPAFTQTLSEPKQFNNLLATMGEIPMGDRDASITKNINSLITANPEFAQNPDYLNRIIKLLQNVPGNTAHFNTLVNSVLIKTRENLVKNRHSLNLTSPQWGKYSETIRSFSTLISQNLRSDFFRSLDTELLEFVLGKHGKKSKPDLQQVALHIREKQKKKPLLFTPDDPEANSTKAHEILTKILGNDYQEQDLTDLVQEMFANVSRLEPELISAVIISLVKNLPYGRLFFENRQEAIEWLYSL